MNYEEIKSLMHDVEKSNLDSIEIELPEGTKVKMRKSPIIYSGINMENVISSNKEEAKNIVQENEVTKFENINESFKENKQNYKTIKSPMVGTFYLKSLPTAEPFVRVGDKVKKGDVLCIIEAMKLMNEIESDVDGEIAEICYKDEELVEYGSVLFKIK